MAYRQVPRHQLCHEINLLLPVERIEQGALADALLVAETERARGAEESTALAPHLPRRS
jgi:hypothetical protein